MRIATMALLLVVIAFTTAAQAEVIRVVRLEVNDNAVFSCGDRCKFRGALPNEPLRVRIIRGTTSELVAVTNDPRYTAAGCIELYSTVVRPRRSRRAADLLDLRFYFSDRWLASQRRDGQFVFVVERDDRPDGPAIEKTSMLRLPVGREGAKYFAAGVDVAVRAPVNTPSGEGFFLRLFSATRSATAALAAPTAEAAPAGDPAPATVMDVALPAAAPRPTAVANCVDLQIDPQPVIIRRADAPVRGKVVRIAVK